MDNATDAIKNIRDRLAALNTKAYYLLVALSFLYSKNATLSLKLALTLTAVVAVFPVQDYFKSEAQLNRIRWFKVTVLTVAFFSTVWWAWFSHVASAAADQKTTPPQATEQKKPKESAGDLESRLKATEEKADRALMEKDYIERIQTDAKAYYEKAFNTQLIIVSIMGLFLAAVGKFGVDHIVDSKLTEASANLRAAFAGELAAELEKLRESNAAQVKILQNDLEKRISELEDDLNCRTYYNFYLAQGQAAGADGRHEDALDSFRRALKTYKSGKTRGLFTTESGGRVIRNILVSIEHLHKDNRTQEARKELAGELYDALEDEVAHGAGGFEWLSSLVAERILAKPPIEKPYPSIVELPNKALAKKGEQSEKKYTKG